MSAFHYSREGSTHQIIVEGFSFEARGGTRAALESLARQVNEHPQVRALYVAEVAERGLLLWPTAPVHVVTWEDAL